MPAEGWPAPSWENHERRFRQGVERGTLWVAPMLELTRRVIRSGIGRSLHASASHYRLRCMMHAFIYRDEPALVVVPSDKATYELVFEQPSQPSSQHWRATYDAEALFPAFSRFLQRVGWVPEGHPAHKMLMGEA